MIGYTANPIIKIVLTWTETNTDFISQGLNIKNPKELLVFERMLFGLLIQLGALIIEWVLKTRIENKIFQKTVARDYLSTRSRKFKFHTYLETPVQTLFGNTVKVKTRYYSPASKRGRKRKNRTRGKNGAGFYPVFKILGINDGVTPALASEISREVTEGPAMEDAQERLERRGIVLDIKKIQRISEKFAMTGLKIRKDWLETGGRAKTPLIPEGETLKGLRVLIGTDGGRIRTRINKRGRKPNGKRSGYRTDWREPKLLVIRAIDDSGKVIREIPPVYDGTLDNADALFELLEAHLRARHINEAQEIVCTCDGAHWIWDRIDGMLGRLGVDPSKISHVVDFYHAVEHISKVADGQKSWSQKKRSRWLNMMKGALREGRIDEVIKELKNRARGRNARVITKEADYFEGHKSRMRYDQLALRGLPLGSGAVESAIKHVVNMRLKSAGMFWLEENAEGFLHLRSYLNSGRWEILENAVIGYDRVGV